jgi:16S rRNA (guanine(966)-N(2))-methyltransferase RsmD
VRVIAGTAKGRQLVAVPGEGTRPITDRVKESLFDILGSDIVGSSLLDLFGGTGGVGIEALSRGAERVVFIERARKAIATIRRNLEITGLGTRAAVIHEDAFRYLAGAPLEQPFDYVYVAPPQYEELWVQALQALDERPEILAPDGAVIVQIHPREWHEVALRQWELARERRYGSTLLLFYGRREEGSGNAAPAEDNGREPAERNENETLC